MNFSSALNRVRRWRPSGFAHARGNLFDLALIVLILLLNRNLVAQESAPHEGIGRPIITAAEAFAIEEAADIVVHFTRDGSLDIGVGVTEKRGDQVLRKPHYFPLEALKGFFEHQRHKGLIVVIFEKGVPEKDSLEDAIKKLNDYFRERGYKRIVLQQARGSGRGTHSDITVSPF